MRILDKKAACFWSQWKVMAVVLTVPAALAWQISFETWSSKVGNGPHRMVVSLLLRCIGRNRRWREGSHGGVSPLSLQIVRHRFFPWISGEKSCIADVGGEERIFGDVNMLGGMLVEALTVGF